jgi:signal transduction histidine kinase
MTRRSRELGPASTPGELMAAVAHEIGTPMTTILGYAELLAKSAADEKSRQRANTIVEQVHRVSRLTERLLVSSRASGASPRVLELGELLDAGLAACAEALERRGVRLERPPASARRVVADAGRLQQLIVQLLREAIDATPQEGTLRVVLAETPAGEVELSACPGLASGDAASGGGAGFRLALPAAPGE